MMDEAVMQWAARSGNLKLVKWLRAEGCDGWDEDTCARAALGRHLKVLQWLRAKGCPWDYETCENAVIKGHVETLRWARANGCPWMAHTRDDAAAELGYTDDFGNLVDENHDPIYDEGNADDVLASVGDNV